MGRLNRTCVLPGVLALVLLANCNQPHKSEGEKLAVLYCGTCHAYPDPQLLDKKTWETGVLPQMAPRLGVRTAASYNDAFRNPHMTVLTDAVSEEEWAKIVRYYREAAPDVLPSQSVPAQPEVDPSFFRTGPFVPRLQSSGIITLLKTDSTHERIFVGEAGFNRLRIFDWNRHLISSLTLDSPPTDLIVERNSVLVLESGILNPNDEPQGTLVRYDSPGIDSLRSPKILIDSLFRPVFVRQFDFDRDGVNEFLICEYGDNRGRLALYKYNGSRYDRHVLDPGAGAIRFEIRDMTGDGSADIVALFAQADERIVLFENDGKGNLSGRQRLLARFPPVYGSMYFSMQDFNGDGRMDIVYVNGDNFDYSRVLKPYHGIRILENDGKNNFVERFFFPVYGAARAEVADFDKDGDLDILTTSNFAEVGKHPERGIMFFSNIGRYQFRPYAFTVAASSYWNLTATADLNNDGRLDIVVGAMDLAGIAELQRGFPGPVSKGAKDPILFLENRMPANSSGRTR